MKYFRIQYNAKSQESTITSKDKILDTQKNIEAVQIIHNNVILGLLTSGNFAVVGNRISYDTEPFENGMGNILKVTVR